MIVKYLDKITNIQNAVGTIGSIILFIIAAIVISWGITCLFVYWISVFWANSPLAFEWSWEFATGVWLALWLISCFCNINIKVDD